MNPIHFVAAACAALTLSGCGGSADPAAHDTASAHGAAPADLQAPVPDGPRVTPQRFVSQPWSETEGGPRAP